jgi:aspartyl protease family protein
MRRTLQHAAVWIVVALLVWVAYSTLEKSRKRAQFQIKGNLVELHRGDDGHYHWPGTVNGRQVEFLVDTGATRTALSAEFAKSLTIETRGMVEVGTAAGSATGSLARVDIALDGGMRVDTLRVVVLPGLGDKPLLGMDVLGRLRWQQHQGVLTFDLRETPPESTTEKSSR